MTPENHQVEFRATTSNASLIGGAAFIGALVGFVLQLLVAFYFGAGSSTDAFFMAQSTSEMVSKLLLGGSITAVFIPMFIERLVQGKREDAWGMALNIFHILAAVYLVFIIALAFFARPFIQFVAPGFDQQTFNLTVSLLNILLPSFFFLFLVEFATSMLQALKRFALPASLRVVSPAISILTIVFLAQHFGIIALAIGVVIGSVVQIAILAYGLRREGFAYRFIFRPLDPTIRHLLHLVYPFFFSVLMTQGAGIVYRIFVSDLSSGSLASIKFAEKITQLITIMFLNSVTMVIFPTLSEKASRGDVVGMRQTMASAIRLIVFVTVPLVIGVALLRRPLISLLYERGSFSAEDAAMTSIALLFLVIGLTTNGISSVLGHTVLALKQTRIAVAVSIASQAIAISLFVLLVPAMDLAGLALASSLVPVAIAALYAITLMRKIPKLGTIFIHPTYLKTAILAVLLALSVVWTRNILEATPAVIQLIGASTAGIAVFFGGSYLWRVEEMHEVIAIARQKALQWRGI